MLKNLNIHLYIKITQGLIYSRFKKLPRNIKLSLMVIHKTHKLEVMPCCFAYACHVPIKVQEDEN